MTYPNNEPRRVSDQAAHLPSVAVLLLSYNCKPFIAAALDSALSQDYRGSLEIIVSDDASSDGTFDLLQEQIAAYRGAHRVELRRRTVNSGSKSAHCNDIFPSVTSDILVSFDGDDISEPYRVTRLVERFRANDTVQAVYSSFSLIDATGQPRGNAHVRHPPTGVDAAAWFARVDAYASGATLAIHRRVATEFGPLDPAVNEDVVLPFRASLLGRVEFVDAPLVRVRRHAESFTADWQRFASLDQYRARMQLGIERAEWALRSRLADLDIAATREPDESERWQRLREVARRSFRNAEATRALTSRSLAVRLRALFELARLGAYTEEFPQHTCLALTPALYLRYKRYKLGLRRPELQAGT